MCDCSSPSTLNVLVRDMIHLCWGKLDWKCCWSRRGVLKGKCVPAFMAKPSAERLLIGFMTNPGIGEEPRLEPWGAGVRRCPTPWPSFIEQDSPWACWDTLQWERVTSQCSSQCSHQKGDRYEQKSSPFTWLLPSNIINSFRNNLQQRLRVCLRSEIR